MKVKACFIILLLATTTAAVAQSRHWGTCCRSEYNRQTEVNIAGTIAEITEVDGWTYLVVKTNSGTAEVHLGPTDFLQGEDVVLKQGDRIQVIGSKLSDSGGEFINARRLVIGDKTIIFRDSAGRRAWHDGRHCCC